MAFRTYHKFSIPPGFIRQRLDLAIAELLPEYSRARLQQWIKAGNLTVDGRLARPKDRILGGENVVLDVDQTSSEDRAESIPLDVVFSDEHLLVINKPADLVVHPGAGNPSGTLLNALLHFDSDLANVPRAGIVHRLDKDTSGLMVVARTLEAQNSLVQAIQRREVNRVYEALVYGVVHPEDGRVDGAIGRHPVQRKKMAIRQDGKSATTYYRLIEQFDQHAHVECRLESGRTHQIRVHMQSIGLSLIGDVTYGGSFRRPRNGDTWLEDALRGFGRQALHARKLEFSHPVSRQRLSFRTRPPADFEELLDLLRGE